MDQQNQNKKPNTKQHKMHYNLFEFDEKLTHFFHFDAIRNISVSETDKQIDVPLHIGNHQVPEYTSCLIEGQLAIQVFDQGIGNYAKKGQYVKYRKRVYSIANPANDLDKGTVQYHYVNNEQFPLLNLVMGLCRVRFKARLEIRAQLSRSIVPKLKIDDTLIMEIQIIAICDTPLTDCFNKLCEYHNSIIKLAISADQAFQNNEIEQCLTHYESAVGKIQSEYYKYTIQHYAGHANKENSQFKQKGTLHQTHEELKSEQMRNVIIEQMQELAIKIMLKAIQVAFICQQYFKVIKWTYASLNSNKNNEIGKLYLKRALSYVQLQQFDKALQDLDLAFKHQNQGSKILQQIQKIKKVVEQRQAEQNI